MSGALHFSVVMLIDVRIIILQLQWYLLLTWLTYEEVYTLIAAILFPGETQCKAGGGTAPECSYGPHQREGSAR